MGLVYRYKINADFLVQGGQQLGGPSGELWRDVYNTVLSPEEEIDTINIPYVNVNIPDVNINVQNVNINV